MARDSAEVKEEVGGVEVLVALGLALRGLGDEHLARADDLGLERELLERGDRAGRTGRRWRRGSTMLPAASGSDLKKISAGQGDGGRRPAENGWR